MVGPCMTFASEAYRSLLPTEISHNSHLCMRLQPEFRVALGPELDETHGCVWR